MTVHVDVTVSVQVDEGSLANHKHSDALLTRQSMNFHWALKRIKSLLNYDNYAKIDGGWY